MATFKVVMRQKTYQVNIERRDEKKRTKKIEKKEKKKVFKK